MTFNLINTEVSIPIDLRVELSLHMYTIEDLKNINKDVLRNDPCICGSGKKFKKCHMDLFIKHFYKRTGHGHI